MNLEDLRDKACEAWEAGNYMMRSCWNCNSAHEHLKLQTETHVLDCFSCGHYYFQEVDITEEEE